MDSKRRDGEDFSILNQKQSTSGLTENGNISNVDNIASLESGIDLNNCNNSRNNLKDNHPAAKCSSNNMDTVAQPSTSASSHTNHGMHQAYDNVDSDDDNGSDPGGTKGAVDEVHAAADGSDGGDASDCDSDVSEISGLSDLEHSWRPESGAFSWVSKMMSSGEDPRPIVNSLIAGDAVIPDDLDDLTLWKIIINILSEPDKRKKLPDINTLDQVVNLIHKCQKIMILTGAGVSVSCGIPDFRSKDGIYSRLAEEYPDIPDPQAMFDIRYFEQNPRPFFKFAKEIYPGRFSPSPCHKFIRRLEERGCLLRNYTQNIDTLEQVAGLQKVIQCHGSFAKASCRVCKLEVDCKAIEEDIMNQKIPYCPKCTIPDDEDEKQPIIKPNIVFFGESLPNSFHKQMEIDKDDCDLLIVIGSSLKVRPVALIPTSLPAKIPQILINREPLRHMKFDVELLGDGDTIINELCHRLGPDWADLCTTKNAAREVNRGELKTPPPSPKQTETQGHRNSPTPNGNSKATKRELDNHTEIEQCDSTLHKTDGEPPVKRIKTAEDEDENSTPKTSTYESRNGVKTESGGSTDLTEEEPGSPEKGQKDSDENKVQESTAAGASEADDCKPSTSRCGGTSDDRPVVPTDPLRVLRKRINLADLLEDGSFLFVPPCRYVFKGAEAIEIQRGPNDSMDDSSDDSDSGSELSDVPDNISDSAENCGNPENRDKIDNGDSNVPQAECSNTKTGHVDNVMVEKNDSTRHKQDSLENSTADTNEDCQKTKQETDSFGQNSVTTNKTN